jgi:hypothetical protein
MPMVQMDLEISFLKVLGNFFSLFLAIDILNPAHCHRLHLQMENTAGADLSCETIQPQQF